MLPLTPEREHLARHLAAGPPGAVELITELGQRPREQWEEVHARHRSHYAHDLPGEQRTARTIAGGPAMPPR